MNEYMKKAMVQMNRKECVEVQQIWLNKKDKIEY